MKLKSNKDRYQGQYEAWKSAIYILQELLLKCHINFKKNQNKLRCFPNKYICYPCTYSKILAQNFDFWPLFRGAKDCSYGILTFLKASYACGLGEVLAWHLAGKRGVKVDPWEGGGLRFNSGWWRIDTMMCR
jgi:hypothetical protein